MESIHYPIGGRRNIAGAKERPPPAAVHRSGVRVARAAAAHRFCELIAGDASTERREMRGMEMHILFDLVKFKGLIRFRAYRWRVRAPLPTLAHSRAERSKCVTVLCFLAYFASRRSRRRDRDRLCAELRENETNCIINSAALGSAGCRRRCTNLAGAPKRARVPSGRLPTAACSPRRQGKRKTERKRRSTRPPMHRKAKT